MRKKYINAPMIVIAGRPNVGKSTLFNRLVGKRRSITDETAGVTRDLVEETVLLKDKPVRLVDSGGFKLSRSKNEAEEILTKLTIEKTLEALERADRILLLLDATSRTAEDDEFVQYLRRYWNKIVVAVNKTEGGRGQAEGYNYLRLGISNINFISAEHGDNIAFCNRLRLKHCAAQRKQKIPKSAERKAFEYAFEHIANKHRCYTL